MVELWHSGGEADPIEGWELSSFEPDRRFIAHYFVRALIALLLVGSIGAGVWYLTGWQAARNQSEIEALDDSARHLVASVSQLRAVIADLADGTLADPAAATTALGDLSASARDLFDSAAGLPAESLLRTETLTVAQQALDIESAVGDAISYGLAFSLVSSLPELPTELPEEEVPEVAAEVAWWVGRFVEGADSLPGHALLTEHRQQVIELAEGLEDWQVNYLDGLRKGEADVAERHLVEIELRLVALNEAWSQAATEVADWGETAVEVLVERTAELTPTG